jgi:hypothetical protein
MRTHLAHSEASARNALEGLLSQDGGRLPMLRVFHEAAADVERSLKFWKKIVRKIPSQHRLSREFLNRQG